MRDHLTKSIKLATVTRHIPLPVEFFEERHDSLGLDKIDERISDVAFVLEINGKVEKIVLPLVRRIDLVQE